MNQQIEHTGIIRHIDGSRIQVLIVQQSACSACHAKGACTAADQTEKMIELESADRSLKVGDTVLLYGQSSMGLFAVLLAFVVPFILILLALFAFQYSIKNEAVLGGLALLVLIPYYGTLSLFSKKLKKKFQFHIKKE